MRFYLVSIRNLFGTVSNIASDNLKWESTQQFNVGVDFGILDNRITGSVDYYIKNTEDLLFPKPISQTSGFAEVIDNIGTLTNKGFEISFLNFLYPGMISMVVTVAVANLYMLVVYVWV